MQSSLSATVHLDPNRQPVLLLLAGGMAAGKSTVRELIGKSDFWSQVVASSWTLKCCCFC